MADKGGDPNTQAEEVSELGRKLAAQRRIVEGTCKVCGTPFTGTRKRRYCSHKCAQKAYETRQRLDPGRGKRSDEEGGQS